MSQQLINRSADLSRLRNEGYDIEIRENHLLLKDIPYVNAAKKVCFGILVSELSLAGDTTTAPGSHIVFFVGEHPCNVDGSEIAQIKHQAEKKSLGNDLIVDRSFSNKPKNGSYKDYYEKLSRYVEIISNPALSLDSSVTPRTFPVIETTEEESVFHYLDTASSRAGIGSVTNKLKLGKIAIVGLGGTGAYVLDLVAKTPVQEIHVFDGDEFSSHNAFRSPGAASIEDLRARQLKVGLLKSVYSRMHRRIISHSAYVDSSNVGLLRDMEFVFICIDAKGHRRTIVEALESWNTPFIDVGMGVELVDDSLLGIVRVTLSTPAKRDHVRAYLRIPLSDEADENDLYASNIQVADLNALNAVLAVIKWKKLCGFYHDQEKEHFCAYTIDGNRLTNQDQS